MAPLRAHGDAETRAADHQRRRPARVGKSGVVTKVGANVSALLHSSLGAFRSRSRTRKALPPTRTRRARTRSSTGGTRPDSRCFGWAGWRKPSPASPPRWRRPALGQDRLERIVRTNLA